MLPNFIVHDKPETRVECRPRQLHEYLVSPSPSDGNVPHYDVYSVPEYTTTRFPADSSKYSCRLDNSNCASALVGEPRPSRAESVPPHSPHSEGGVQFVLRQGRQASYGVHERVECLYRTVLCMQLTWA